MILTVDSDAAYLVMPKARSRMAGYFRLLDNENKIHRHKQNGAIHIECRTIKHVVSSAAEAETNATFNNAKIAVPLRHVLIAMGHPQPPTLISTDNSTCEGFVNNNIQLKKSKSWDMHMHWLRDREQRKHFLVKYGKGKDNDSDYFTKHHPTTHHLTERKKFVRDVINSSFQSFYQTW